MGHYEEIDARKKGHGKHEKKKKMREEEDSKKKRLRRERSPTP